MTQKLILKNAIVLTEPNFIVCQHKIPYSKHPECSEQVLYGDDAETVN